MDIMSMVDNEDGSMDMTVELTNEELVYFARQGLLAMFKEEVARYEELLPNPRKPSDQPELPDDAACEYAVESIMCAGCTCWKNPLI